MLTHCHHTLLPHLQLGYLLCSTCQQQQAEWPLGRASVEITYAKAAKPSLWALMSSSHHNTFSPAFCPPLATQLVPQATAQ